MKRVGAVGCFLTILLSCGDGKVTDLDFVGANAASAMIAADTFTATSAVLGHGRFGFVLELFDDLGTGIVLSVTDNGGVGTFQFGVRRSSRQLTYATVTVAGGEPSTATDVWGSGRVTVSEFSDGVVAGTFEFIGLDPQRMRGPAVTNGQFEFERCTTSICTFTNLGGS